MCLFSVNAGVIAFEGKILEGDSDFVDTRSMEKIGIDVNTFAPFDSDTPINQLDTNTSYTATTTTKEEGDKATETARSGFDILKSDLVVNGLVGYWVIIDKIFYAFPELSFPLKAVLLFLQSIGIIYAVLVLAALLRGGYNPG